MTSAVAVTDGSFCPRTFAAGWAYRIQGKKWKVKRHGPIWDRCETSLDAEIYAAKMAVEVAIRKGVTRLKLKTDCMALVNRVNELGLFGEDFDQIEAFHVHGHPKFKARNNWAIRWCDQKAWEEMARQSIEYGGW